MSLVTRPLRWLRAHPYAISVLILGAAMALSFWVDHQQNERERREDAIERITLASHDARTECRSANESRALIREIGVQLSVANAEALVGAIQAAGSDATPETIEDFLARTRANAQTTVSALGPRNCVREAAEARQIAADIEGIEP